MQLTSIKTKYTVRDLIEAGVDEQVAIDFFAHRKKCKSPVSKTAINSIAKEALKAGISLNVACGACVTENWRGFKAEWYKKRFSNDSTGFIEKHFDRSWRNI